MEVSNVKTITVVSDERSGLLADLSYVLGKAGINIEGLNIDVLGGKAVVSLEIKDPQKAQSVLDANGYKYLPLNSLVVKVSAVNESSLSEVLKSQKIMATLSEITSDTSDKLLALEVDKPRKASKVLSNFLFSPLMTSA